MYEYDVNFVAGSNLLCQCQVVKDEEDVALNMTLSLPVERFGELSFLIVRSECSLDVVVSPNEFTEYGALHGWQFDENRAVFKHFETGEEVSYFELFGHRQGWSNLSFIED